MIKKYFVFLLVFLATSAVLHSKVDIGGMIGLSGAFGKFEPSDASSQRTTLKPSFSVYTNFHVTDNIGIQINPTFKQTKTEATYFIADFLLESDAFEIPFLLRYELDLGGIKPYAIAGPNLRFIMNPRLSSDFNDMENEDVSDDINQVEFALMGGIGLEVDLNIISVFGQVYYNHGISNIYDPEVNVSWPDEIYTREFGFQIGAAIQLGDD